jgi:hypothetical protein
MTKKEFSRRRREIMASTELTEKGKSAAIECTATRFIEDIISGFPEIRSVEKRVAAIEDKYLTGRKGTTFCPACSTWSPKEPPAIEALSQKWVEIKDRKTEELCRKVLAGKAA